MNGFLRYRNTIIAVVIIAVFSLIIYSIYSHYAEQLQGVTAKRLELQRGSETMDKWLAIQNRYTSLGQQLLRGDPALFKQFIEEKARISDIYITSLNMGQDDKGFYWKVTIDFEASCFYSDLIKFSRLLEDKKVKLTIASISKKSAPDRKEEGVILKSRVEGIVIK